MPLVLDGNGDITGLVAGALPSTVIGAGAVLQVVNATYSTETSSSTATYADTGLSASITPSSSSSKILVIVSVNGVYKNGSNASIGLNVMRDATQITQIAINGLSYTGDTSASQTSGSINYLDSPAATSATTYKVQFKNGASSGANVTINDSSCTSTITLLEIKQ
jgi:hypothetical protein